MALTPSSPQIQFHFPSTPSCLIFPEAAVSLFLASPTWPQLQIAFQKSRTVLSPVTFTRPKCFGRSIEEDQLREQDGFGTGADADDIGFNKDERRQNDVASIKSQKLPATFSSDSLSLGIRDPVYEVCLFFLGAGNGESFPNCSSAITLS